MSLNAETIQTRAKHGNPRGRQKTPMEQMEPCLVAMCLERHRVNQRFTEAQFLEFANSLVQGKETLQEAIDNKEAAKTKCQSRESSWLQALSQIHGPEQTCLGKFKSMQQRCQPCSLEHLTELPLCAQLHLREPCGRWHCQEIATACMHGSRRKHCRNRIRVLWSSG